MFVIIFLNICHSSPRSPDTPSINKNEHHKYLECITSRRKCSFYFPSFRTYCDFRRVKRVTRRSLRVRAAPTTGLFGRNTSVRLSCFLFSRLFVHPFSLTSLDRDIRIRCVLTNFFSVTTVNKLGHFRRRVARKLFVIGPAAKPDVVLHSISSTSRGHLNFFHFSDYGRLSSSDKEAAK